MTPASLHSPSGIYTGSVIHSRLRPRRHKLRYRVFSLLLDLDELSTLHQNLRVFSVNRTNLFSFWEKDHGDGSSGGLRKWVLRQIGDAGIATSDLKISILCYPRIFGYAFNPLTVYFCYDGDGVIKAIVYEVCNTFHERHAYVIPIRDSQDGTVTHACDKELYVSPFVPMDCRYDFTIGPPAERVKIAIRESDPEGMFLYAMFEGKRSSLDDRGLAIAFFRHPLMTFKVTAAIHWEALRLWLKRIPVYRHSRAASARSATIVATPHKTEI